MSIVPLFIAVSMFANSLFFVDQPWFLIFAAFFLGYHHYHQKFGSNAVLIYLLASWLIINLIAFLFHRTGFSVITFFGYAIRMSIAFFLVHSWRGEFWEKFERIVYLLTIVSIGFYGLNLVIPGVFHEMKVIFQPFTNPAFLRKAAQEDYWNNFFYTHSGRDDWRNSGFMWEPGAFAMSSVVMIVYNWVRGGIKFSRRFWVYSFAIFTTLSTAGFISLTLLIFVKSLNRKLGVAFVLFAVILLSINRQVLYNDFLIPKIEQFIKEAEEDTVYNQEFSDRLEANRIAYFGINVMKTLEYPLGHGVVEDRKSFSSAFKVVGVGGLSDVLYKWGLIGFLGFLWVINRLLTVYLPAQTNVVQRIGIFFALLIPLFSNPIETTLIGFFLLFSYFLPKRDLP
jgi:hypothetical protein